MTEYIEKQEAINALKEYFSDEERTETEYGAYWHHVHVIKCIEEMRAEDVKPVVHGHWIEKKDAEGKTYGKCSSCGYEQYAGHLKYCPECGSKNYGTYQ